MIELPITKDITKYKPKLLLGLTTRQAICVVLAAVVVVPLYFFLNTFFIREFTFAVCLIVASPFILCGFVSPYGMNFETFFLIILKVTFSPTKRKYIQKNLFEEFFNKFDDEGNLIQASSLQNTKKPQTTNITNKQVSSDPDLYCSL